MDIRGALNEIIELYGHNVIYVRRDTKFRCECFSSRNGQADARCKKCLGTGYSITYEQIKVRSRIVDGYGNLSDKGEVVAPKGIKQVKSTVYYFPERLHPKEGDLILEVEWTDEGKVKRIRDKHFISISDPKLGVQGRIEFYQVHCKFEESRESDGKTIASSSISSTAAEL